MIFISLLLFLLSTLFYSPQAAFAQDSAACCSDPQAAECINSPDNVPSDLKNLFDQCLKDGKGGIIAPASQAPKDTPESPEEKAMTNLNLALLPEETRPVANQESQGILNQIEGGLKKIFGGLLERLAYFNVRSGLSFQAKLPEGFKPASNNPIEQTTNTFVRGVFGVDLPEAALAGTKSIRIGPIEIKGTQESRSSEEGYEQANFPAEVKPVTGQ